MTASWPLEEFQLPPKKYEDVAATAAYSSRIAAFTIA